MSSFIGVTTRLGQAKKQAEKKQGGKKSTGKNNSAMDVQSQSGPIKTQNNPNTPKKQQVKEQQAPNQTMYKYFTPIQKALRQIRDVPNQNKLSQKINYSQFKPQTNLGAFSRAAVVAKQAQFQKKKNSTNYLLRYNITDPTYSAWTELQKAGLAYFQDGKWRSKYVGARAIKAPKYQSIMRQMQLVNSGISTLNGVALNVPFISVFQKRMAEAGLTTGMGKITKNGVPFFIGRYYDPQTNRVRVLPKPPSYYNPLDLDQLVGYRQLNAVNKWNQFAQSIQEVTKAYQFQARPQLWNMKMTQSNKRNGLDNKKKMTLKNVLNNIVKSNDSNNPVYKQLKPDQKIAYYKQIRAGNYNNVTKSLQDKAVLKLAQKTGIDTKPGQLISLQSLSMIQQKPYLQAAKYRARTMIKFDKTNLQQAYKQAMNGKQYIQKLKDQAYKQTITKTINGVVDIQKKKGVKRNYIPPIQKQYKNYITGASAGGVYRDDLNKQFYQYSNMLPIQAPQFMTSDDVDTYLSNKSFVNKAGQAFLKDKTPNEIDDVNIKYISKDLADYINEGKLYVDQIKNIVRMQKQRPKAIIGTDVLLNRNQM